MDSPSLNECLNSILTGSTEEEIYHGWENLTKLDKINASDIKYAASIIINNNTSININQMLKILNYLPDKCLDNPFDIMETNNNNYKTFLLNIAKKNDITLFTDIIKQLINNNNIYLTNFKNYINFCESIVICLSVFQMPLDPPKINELKVKTAEIHNYILKLIEQLPNDQQKDHLLYISLDTLHKIITDDDKFCLSNEIPGAALVGILRLLNQSLIRENIKTIINKSTNDENLERTFFTLCTWQTQWLKEDNLIIWITHFIECLESNNKQPIILSVANQCLFKMIKLLILPMAVEHMTVLVCLMLQGIDCKLFLKLIKPLENSLLKLQDDARRQSIIDHIEALILRYPGYSKYQSIQRISNYHPNMYNVNQIFTKLTSTFQTEIMTDTTFNCGHVGLTNLGNTCYVNSVLQALLMSRDFCHQILNCKIVSKQKDSILIELQNLFALLLYTRRIYLSPEKFCQVSKPSYFVSGQQQDSSEFLCYLLDALSEQEKSNLILNDHQCQSDIELTQEKTATQSSLIHSVFGGELNIAYKCLKCETISHNNDKFHDFQLCFPEKMPENKQISIQDLIDYYLAVEKLTGDNMYRCTKCNDLCDAERNIEILQSPNYLILILKHFNYDAASGLRTKLHHKVIYNETINVQVKKTNCFSVESYKLYAAVIHSGYSMDYGHYFTYAKNSKQKWYKFNDNFVSETTLNNFFSLERPDTPYILFYEKKLTNINTDNYPDKLELNCLSKHIQDLIQNDHLAYDITNKKLNQRKSKISNLSDLSYQRKNSHDNSDDENPPPTRNCREAGDLPTNHFLY